MTGLDPASRVLADHYDEIVAEFTALPFSWFDARLPDLITARRNDPRELVRALALG